MAIFSYEAMDNQGKEVRGEIEANSEREATEKIRAANLYPTRIDSKAGAQSGGRSTARSGATGARASGVKKPAVSLFRSLLSPSIWLLLPDNFRLC
jgi:type II secretory pathway component PulF